MKKTFFSLLGAAIVVTTVLFSCSKTDNSGLTVGYSNQKGTGHNNGSAGGSTAGGLTTTGTASTTGTSTTTGNTLTVGTTTTTVTSGPTCGLGGGVYTVSGTTAADICTITFLTTPTVSGTTYTIIPPGTLTSSTAYVSINQAGTTYNGQSGLVTVTITGGKVKASFAAVNCTAGASSLTVSATLQCP